MNKAIMAFVLVSGLLFGLVMVSAQGVQNGTGVNNDAIMTASGQNGTAPIFVKRVIEGTYDLENGGRLGVEIGEDNRTRLRIRDIEAHSDIEITSQFVGNRIKLRAKLSNGRDAEIKIMPDTASERALQRLRLRNCSEECVIELKQVGKGEKAKLAYELQTERHSKILGLFQAKMQVRAQVDAETGEILRVGKPWWAFLAAEPEEE